MGVSSRASLGRLLDLTVSALDNPQALWPTACEELARTLGTRLAGRFEVRWPVGVTRSQLLNEGVWTGTIPWTPPEVAIHPLVRTFATTSDLTPRTLDDVADDEWRTSAEHAVSRERFEGAFAQVLVPLRRPGNELHYLGAVRTGREFNERERSYLSRLQPLLIAIERHVREVDRLRRDLALTVLPTADPRPSAAEAGLTVRESVVLALLVDGLSPARIASRLGISVRTVLKHQENIYRKLGVHDRVNAVLAAQRLKLAPVVPQE
ncbi:helix-turn-helix transcriptional regulator [Frankia sp. Cas3]|uniref:helix-turn-helix transcriptional regulator n=1 Tax=Frankia sp. Cas3 TaxID=3073926 RepID=UPI002AD30931|nr:LuxR C-terminal-related transcriptional regulator [Frankia sp. Cas3]